MNNWSNWNWGACGTCIGTKYVDENGNATGDGNTYVSNPAGVAPCTVPGWMIAAGVGVFLLAVTAGKGR